MPLKRYQIKNEYSLADQELYRVASKDDPEALLEGVAMAGLVGVLRQLGDLAEFAAEVFHDLHEEVMATAARGHGLTVRVQQLEAEFSPVERTLLSQTSHTSFLYNSGVGWHPNLHVDQNTITKGDLPRFVMGSYEECRGPPQLFLLDKFDVAGAGACLKRYTDPSFFKDEATSSTGRNSEGQRERKTRRVKKRGPRWRIGDTPETFSSSHAKLHQLFLEERIETGGSDPDCRVKLKKRQFTGSLFDQGKGKSYMEKFLDACPSEQKIIHEICIDPLPLPWASEQDSESGLEMAEIGNVSFFKESIETERNTSSSPDAVEVVVKPSMDDFIEGKSSEIVATEDVELTGFNHERDYGKLSPTIKVVRADEYLDGECMSEIGVNDGLNSEDITSDIDYYVDTLPIIESDSECEKNPKNMNLKTIGVDSGASGRKTEPQSSDAQSVGSSIMSVDGNNFLMEGESSSCSVSVDNLAETTLDHNVADVTVPSVPSSKLDLDNISVDLQSMSEDICENRSDEHPAGSTVGESSLCSVSVDTLAETTPALDAAVVGFPSIPVSKLDFNKLSVDHYYMAEEVPGSKPEEHAASNVAFEADDSSKSEEDLKEASTSCVTDQQTKPLLVDVEAKSRKNCLPSLDVNEVYSNSTKADIASGISNDRHADQCATWSNSGKIADASEKTDCGDWSQGEHMVYDAVGGNSSVYSESLLDLSNKSDGSVDWCHEETKEPDSVVSLVEERSNDGRADVDVCSDTRPTLFHPHIYGFKYPETTKPTSSVSNVDLCSFSSEGLSSDQFSAAYPSRDFEILEQFPEMTPGHTSPPDFEAAALTSSQEDPSIKEVFAGVESEEEAQYAPVVGQTEISPPCSGPQTHAPLSFSEMTSDVETVAAGVLPSGNEPNSELLSGSAEGGSNSIVMEKLPPLLDPSETQKQLQSQPFGKTHTALSEHHHLAEKAKQYPGSEASISGDEFNAPNASIFGREVVRQDVTSVCSDQSYQVATVKHLDDSEPLVIQDDATGESGLNGNCDDKEALPYDAFLFHVPSKPASETNSVFPSEDILDLRHDMAKVETTKSGIDGSRQVDAENCHHENVICVTSFSSLYPKKVQEQSFQVTEGCNLNEEELSLRPTAEMTAQKQVDSVQDSPESSNFNVSNMSSDEHPTLTLLNGSLAENVQNNGNSADEETPLTLGHDVKSFFPLQIHLLKGNEDNVEYVTKNLSEHIIPLDERSDLLYNANGVESLHADEPSPQSNSDTKQIDVLQFVDREESINTTALHSHGLYSVSKHPTQSAEHTPESSGQPMVESSSAFAGNETCHGDNQAEQIVENSGLSAYPQGFPVLCMLPADPQVNLDAPPLPPLPPMQWRLSRFQNSSAAPERPMAQHSIGPVQPVLATLSEVPTQNDINGMIRENVLNSSTSTGPQNGTQISADAYVAQQGVQAAPMLQNAYAAPESQMLQQTTSLVQPTPDTVMGVPSHNNMNEIGRDDNLSFITTSMSVRSHNGVQVSPDVYAAPKEVLMQPVLTSTSEISSQNNMNGITGEDNVIFTTPTSGNSQNGNRVSEESYQTNVHCRDPSPMIEGHFDGHSPAVEEVKADTEIGIQAEHPENNPHVREQEEVKEVNSHVEFIPSSKMQPPAGFVAPEEKRTWLSSNNEIPANADRNANGNANDFLQKKLPRPRNPLIDEVVAVELRKVEMVKPPMESKSEERESLLEQLKLRKVERIKPPKETKAEEGESVLEHLQLRKVVDRVIPEVEQKPEETESPRVQLRKLGQRASPLVGSKTEDRDSLLEQIRSKSFNLKPAGMTRPNIQGPNIQGPRTNLKVAAIIEKASNIRQAMAGSDEEEDVDSWSDC